ncbi:MAG: hypothetical protein V3T55_00140 [Anaerolineales bacterium]
MSAPLHWPFQQILLIPFLRLTTRLGGKRAWRAWERPTFAMVFIVDWFACMRRPANDGAIVRMRRMIGKTDLAIGVEGGWVEAGLTRLVKKIVSCAHIQRLWATPEFGLCLGMAIGAGAFRVYAPKARAHYIIPRTLSQGDRFCEHSLALVSETAERWKERKG